MEEAWELAVVTTSANLLHDLLEKASEQTPAHTLSLVEAIGLALGYNKGQDAKAYDFARNLVSKLDDDLELALNSDEITIATGYMSKYRALYHMPIYVRSVKDLVVGNQLLSANSLMGLSTVGLILSGKVERFPVEQSSDYTSKIEDLKNTLIGLDLPEELKEVILKRIQQVQVSVDNCHYFGEKSVAEALEKLVGSIDLYTPSKIKKSSKGKAFFRDLTATVVCVSAMTVGAEKTTASALKMIGHYNTISGYLEDNSGSKKNNSEEE